MGSRSVVIDDRTFEQEVLQATTPVVVDFWAEWCPPCKMIAPVLEEIAIEKDGSLKIAKLDADENPGAVQKFGVQGLPTLLVFKNGREVARILGYRNKTQLLQQIDQAM
ncbi:MAG TPA: thioredoxin [Chloroflexota bacterium]|nr:thioredoxin [Chloroflexota bacterium]